MKHEVFKKYLLHFITIFIRFVHAKNVVIIFDQPNLFLPLLFCFKNLIHATISISCNFILEIKS